MRKKSKETTEGIFPGKTPVKIGIPIYEDFDSLDMAGPNQVFYFLEPLGVDVSLVGPDACTPVRSLEGLRIFPHISFDDCPQLDIFYVPGGYGDGYTNLLKNLDDPYYAFIKKQAERATLVTSVCTGAHIMARAGLLDGYKCTTHWAYKEALELFPDVKVKRKYPRWVIDGNRITGGGISSGIDEALKIAAIIKGDDAAQEVQLSMQYNPNPPFKGGDPKNAPKHIVKHCGSVYAGKQLKKTLEEILDS